MAHLFEVGQTVRILPNHADYGIHDGMLCTVKAVYAGDFETRPYCDVMLPNGEIRRGLWQSRFVRVA